MYQPLHFREDDLATQHQLIRTHPWAVRDAPEDFIRARLKGILGVEIDHGDRKQLGRSAKTGRSHIAKVWRKASARPLVKPRCWIL
ncbi:hypothetical protein SAMN02927900_01454 [Rhizobium mongolense subsp. loessense]|uniref:Uncharacterized protein n=1 Tax=Rhizobium mongolense subsp. loessense TaxID=158890 RepID=A0A1G4Q897_9HYPH|nr:hypothetical protein SAMN02927900_01454 [Rhizobium mongolense subsp. loessense]